MHTVREIKNFKSYNFIKCALKNIEKIKNFALIEMGFVWKMRKKNEVFKIIQFNAFNI